MFYKKKEIKSITVWWLWIMIWTEKDRKITTTSTDTDRMREDSAQNIFQILN